MVFLMENLYEIARIGILLTHPYPITRQKESR